MSEPIQPPAHWFERQDESADEAFYAQPRLVAHIDQATIDALTRFYGDEFLQPGQDVLDLMSSWISHLPADLALYRVAALGMNADELAANPQATEWCVHNLNVEPALPYDAASFDRVLIAVSIQYLTQPLAVLGSVREVLRPGGRLCIAMSHRLFPTKAIAAFRMLGRDERIQLVSYYLSAAGFKDVQFVDRSPLGFDPLWLVLGTT